MGIIKDIYHQSYVCISIIQRKEYFHIISNKFLESGSRVASTPIFNIKTNKDDCDISKYIIKSLEESGGDFLSNGEQEVKNFLSVKTDKALFDGSHYFVVCYTFDTKMIKISKWKKKGKSFIYSDIEEKIILDNDPSIIAKTLKKVIEETPPICY